MNTKSNREQLAREAKAIVALAFRNGPIEDFHAGRLCPTCHGQAGFLRLTEDQMKKIMKNAVDHVYTLLCLKSENPAKYESNITFGERYSAHWDQPRTVKGRKIPYAD
jgi:hypothetical protein